MEQVSGDKASAFSSSDRILVTGGSGFVGSHLLRELVRLNANAGAVIRKAGPRLADIVSSLRIFPCDLTEPGAIAAVVEEFRPTVVFHLAAFGLAPDAPPRDVVRTNVDGTLNLLLALRNCPLRRLISVGSCFEYGEGKELDETAALRPTGIYGATKAAAHLMIHSFRRSEGLPALSLRLFTPFGPWEAAYRLIPHVILCALDGRAIPLTEGRQERDFIYVADVVDALIRATASPVESGDETINICRSESVTVRRLVETILDIMGNPVKAEFGALPYRATEMWVQSGVRRRAKERLGWEPRVSLEDGLSRTIAWFRANRALVGALS